MGNSGLTSQERNDLIELLEHRLAVIGNAELRENDPEEQLRQLQAVSEAIEAFHQSRRERLPIRLRHFLENSSLSKALDWLRTAKESRE